MSGRYAEEDKAIAHQIARSMIEDAVECAPVPEDSKTALRKHLAHGQWSRPELALQTPENGDVSGWMESLVLQELALISAPE